MKFEYNLPKTRYEQRQITRALVRNLSAARFSDRRIDAILKEVDAAYEETKAGMGELRPLMSGMGWTAGQERTFARSMNMNPKLIGDPYIQREFDGAYFHGRIDHNRADDLARKLERELYAEFEFDWESFREWYDAQ